MVAGTIAILGISGISFWLGIQLERSKREKNDRKKYIRRCRLAAKEIKNGIFSDAEPRMED